MEILGSLIRPMRIENSVSKDTLISTAIARSSAHDFDLSFAITSSNMTISFS